MYNDVWGCAEILPKHFMVNVKLKSSCREKLSKKKISTLTLCCQDVVYRQSGQVFIEIKSTSFPKV